MSDEIGDDLIKAFEVFKSTLSTLKHNSHSMILSCNQDYENCDNGKKEGLKMLYSESERSFKVLVGGVEKSEELLENLGEYVNLIEGSYRSLKTFSQHLTKNIEN